MKKFKKIFLILLPVILLSGCRTKHSNEGQIQPLTSPTGEFIVEMPILKSNSRLDYPVWTPTIKDKLGNIVYSDNSSNLSGYHKSYWDWGTIPETGADNLWVYNSDTGEVTVYYSSYGEWEKAIIDMKKEKLEPPEIIKKKHYRY